MNPIRRHPTIPVRVEHLTIGGDAPVVVQSMTNTDTADAPATIRQCAELWRAGSELVRVTVNTEAAARAIPEIRAGLDALGCDGREQGDEDEQHEGQGGVAFHRGTS